MQVCCFSGAWLGGQQLLQQSWGMLMQIKNLQQDIRRTWLTKAATPTSSWMVRCQAEAREACCCSGGLFLLGLCLLVLPVVLLEGAAGKVVSTRAVVT
jgi:hypothetical protein